MDASQLMHSLSHLVKTQRASIDPPSVHIEPSPSTPRTPRTPRFPPKKELLSTLTHRLLSFASTLQPTSLVHQYALATTPYRAIEFAAQARSLNCILSDFEQLTLQQVLVRAEENRGLKATLEQARRDRFDVEAFPRWQLISFRHRFDQRVVVRYLLTPDISGQGVGGLEREHLEGLRSADREEFGESYLK